MKKKRTGTGTGTGDTSNYVKGRRVEYEVKKLFEDVGWTITRAASSKGPWDLVATKITRENRKRVFLVVFCQVKTSRVENMRRRTSE